MINSQLQQDHNGISFVSTENTELLQWKSTAVNNSYHMLNYLQLVQRQKPQVLPQWSWLITGRFYYLCFCSPCLHPVKEMNLLTSGPKMPFSIFSLISFHSVVYQLPLYKSQEIRKCFVKKKPVD